MAGLKPERFRAAVATKRSVAWTVVGSCSSAPGSSRLEEVNRGVLQRQSLSGADPGTVALVAVVVGLGR